MVFSSLNKFKIYNLTEYDIHNEIKIIKKYVKKCLREENVKGSSFNIILITNEDIKKLNVKYRNIEKETDVISFALEDEKNEKFFLKERVLGDIYISVDKAKSQSNEYGHSLKRELSFLVVHGLLHLLGYDHMKSKKDEEIMFSLQDEILASLNILR